MTAESTGSIGRLGWLLGLVGAVAVGAGALVWWRLQPFGAGGKGEDVAPAERPEAEARHTVAAAAPATAPAKPRLIVLVDQSASMGTVDRPGGLTRYARAVELLAPRREQIAEHFRPAWYHSAGQGRGGGATAAAIRAAIEDCDAPDIVGVLLISDGVHDGAAPGTRPAAEGMRVPIYAVGIGESGREGRERVILRRLARQSGGLYAGERDLQGLIAECIAREQDGTRSILPPEVVKAVVRYQFPAYTGLAAKTSEGGSIRAPVGSQVTVTLHLSAPVHGAVVETRAGRPRPVRIAGDGRTLAFRMPVERDGAYRVVLRNARGWPVRRWPDSLDEDKAFHPIRAIPDRPPEIALLEPGANGTAPPGGRLRLTLSARDDYGLSAAMLVCGLASAKDRTRLSLQVPPGRREATLRFEWDLGAAGFPAGSVVEYYAVATDNRTPPQQGRTKRFKLTIRAGADPATRPKQ